MARTNIWGGFTCVILGISSFAFLAEPMCQGANSSGCQPPAQYANHLPYHDGYVEFIPENELRPFKQILPKISDQQLDAALRSEESIWYDEASMVFLYQDSVETVVGGRANCVGRKVGEENGMPIAKLKNLFGTDFRFKFPFRTAAGTDDVTNIKTLNVWVPPRENGKVIPVRWWQESKRGRWRWLFPVGTLFAEVLYEKSPSQKWVVFEIRTRKRYRDGWEVNVYRPFKSATDLAEAIMKARPDWMASIDLRATIKYLQDNETLKSEKLESEAYSIVFPPVEGALDIIPEIKPPALLEEIMRKTSFVSVEGGTWKENRTLATYGPSSASDFGVAPKGYKMGMYPVNEISCNRCHSEVGKKLGDFEFDVILYGEIWGEDRIFTWHLFEPNDYIYETFDDSDGSRKINQRMVKAGLVKNGKPTSNEEQYKELPSAYTPGPFRLKTNTAAERHVH